MARLTLGIPIAVKSTLKGPAMLSFLSTLVEVVLPRVKDFEGVHFVQNEKNGSINFGFAGATMALFPQIEGTLFIFEANGSQFRFIYKFTRFRHQYRYICSYHRRCTTVTLSIRYSVQERSSSRTEETSGRSHIIEEISSQEEIDYQMHYSLYTTIIQN
jgi:ribosomal L5P family C-terminus